MDAKLFLRSDPKGRLSVVLACLAGVVRPRELLFQELYLKGGRLA